MNGLMAQVKGFEMAEQLGMCENCGQRMLCTMVEVAPCVRMRLCADCQQGSTRRWRPQRGPDAPDFPA
jgi:RNA polymerase-binding transcription factor DksA